MYFESKWSGCTPNSVKRDKNSKQHKKKQNSENKGKIEKLKRSCVSVRSQFSLHDSSYICGDIVQQQAAETVLQIWTVCVYLNRCLIVWHLITNLTLNQWAIKNKTQITDFPRRNKMIWVVTGVHEVLLVGRRVDRKITLPAGVSKSRTSPDVSFFSSISWPPFFSLSVRKNKNKQRSVEKPTLLWTLIFSVEAVSKSVSPAPLGELH